MKLVMQKNFSKVKILIWFQNGGEDNPEDAPGTLLIFTNLDKEISAWMLTSTKHQLGVGGSRRQT